MLNIYAYTLDHVQATSEHTHVIKIHVYKWVPLTLTYSRGKVNLP